jgi:hypothetical protein
MAQAVSRRLLTAEDRARSQVSPCGIRGGQSGTGTGFSPSTSVSPRQFHSTSAPLQGKRTKKTNNLQVAELHNKPQGRGASVASATGPFNRKKHTIKISHCNCTLPDILMFRQNYDLLHPLTVGNGRKSKRKQCFFVAFQNI